MTRTKWIGSEALKPLLVDLASLSSAGKHLQARRPRGSRPSSAETLVSHADEGDGPADNEDAALARRHLEALGLAPAGVTLAELSRLTVAAFIARDPAKRPRRK